MDWGSDYEDQTQQGSSIHGVPQSDSQSDYEYEYGTDDVDGTSQDFSQKSASSTSESSVQASDRSRDTAAVLSTSSPFEPITDSDSMAASLDGVRQQLQELDSSFAEAQSQLAVNSAQHLKFAAAVKQADEELVVAKTSLEVTSRKIFAKRQKEKAALVLAEATDSYTAALADLEHCQHRLQAAKSELAALRQMKQRLEQREQEYTIQADASLERTRLFVEAERQRRQEAEEARQQAAEEHSARLAAAEAEAQRKRAEIEAAKPKTPPLFIFAPSGEEGNATNMPGGGGWLTEMASKFARANQHKLHELQHQCADRGLPTHGDVPTLLARLACRREGLDHLLQRWQRADDPDTMRLLILLQAWVRGRNCRRQMRRQIRRRHIKMRKILAEKQSRQILANEKAVPGDSMSVRNGDRVQEAQAAARAMLKIRLATFSQMPH